MRKRALVPALVATFLAACGAVPQRQAPVSATQIAPAMPKNWSVVAPGEAMAGGKWWRVYGDATLDRLVDEALDANLDLVRALARIDQARAIVAITRAAQYPVATLDAGASRSQVSAVNAFPLPSGVPRIQPAYRLGADVSYEIDFWGRYRRATDAARADVVATEEDRETIRMALAADIVKSYFLLAAYDASIASTRRTFESRRQTLELQRERLKSGLASEYEVRTYESELAAAQSILAANVRDRQLAQNALAQLVGRTPQAMSERGIDREEVSDERLPPRMVPGGVPSELLLRRPDLRAVERRMEAADARIDVARAQFFPSVQLSARLGTEAAALSDLFSGPAAIWRLGGSLLQPIFAAGRLEAQIRQSEAVQRELVATYQQSVQGAFREVLDALVAQEGAREILDAESARERSLVDTLDKAQVRYKSGLASQLEVLDAERNLLGARLARIDAARAYRAAIADLARAMGGEWTATAASAESSPARQ